MNEEQAEQQEQQFQQLIAKCWADEGFKAKLLADTAETLKSEGLEVQEGITVKAVENTDSVYHLVIPAKPADLSDEDLDAVVGGSASSINTAIRAVKILLFANKAIKKVSPYV